MLITVVVLMWEAKMCSVKEMLMVVKYVVANFLFG